MFSEMAAVIKINTSVFPENTAVLSGKTAIMSGDDRSDLEDHRKKQYFDPLPTA